MVSPLPKDLGLLPKCAVPALSLVPAHTRGSRSWQQSWGRCEFNTWDVRGGFIPSREIPACCTHRGLWVHFLLSLIPLLFSEIPICLFPDILSPPTSPLMGVSHLSVLGAAEEKWHSVLSLPPQKRSPLLARSAPRSVSLGGGWGDNTGKVSCCRLCYVQAPTLIIYLFRSTEVLESLLGKIGFLKILSYVGICPGQHSPGFSPGHGEMGVGRIAGSIGSAACTDVCLPITGCTGGRDSSQVPWQMALVPITPKGTFVLGWVSNSLFKKGDEKEELPIPPWC